ncbi:uncharacterized protein LOC144528621 [Sander vitreus]
MDDLRGCVGSVVWADIVSRLQQEMKNGDIYDEVFSQIWGALGPQSTDSSTLRQSLTDDDTLGAGAQPPDNSNVSAEQGPRPVEELTDVGPQSTDSSTLADTLGAGMLCGSHCADLTSVGSIEVKRSCTVIKNKWYCDC